MSSFTSIEQAAAAFVADPTQSRRDDVALSMEPVIRSIISKLHLPSDELARPEELYQVGIIAVLQSLDQFDTGSGARFVTFAYARIRGEIIDYLRRLDPLPRRRRAKVASLRAMEDRLSQTEGFRPGTFQVASAMGLTSDDVERIRHDALQRGRVSLFDSREDELSLVDVLEDGSCMESFDALEWADIRRHMDRASEALSDRDRTILELYFGEGLTQQEIGAVLGVTEARVSQIRHRALSRMALRIEPSLRQAA